MSYGTLNNASSSDALRARLEQRVQTLGRPDPPDMVDGTLGTSHQGATKARRNDGEAQVASASSKLRGAVAADVQRMLSDVARMGKTEDDEMTTLRTRVRVLERTVRERDDELRDARPRILALEAELAQAREAAASQLSAAQAEAATALEAAEARSAALEARASEAEAKVSAAEAAEASRAAVAAEAAAGSSGDTVPSAPSAELEAKLAASEEGATKLRKAASHWKTRHVHISAHLMSYAHLLLRPLPLPLPPGPFW